MISSRFRTRALSIGTAVAFALTATACGSTKSPSAGTATRTLTIYAASSLTGAFTTIGKQFEKDHPGVKVVFDFGGSADLVSQIQAGAPADVFASADVKNMAKLTAESLQAEVPADFASNTLEIITPTHNPAKIATLADLAHTGVKLVICAPEVPCGSAARSVATAAGLTFKPVSEEQSVKDVLAKVVSGEADAGLVYVTDVKAAGSTVDGITFPEASSAVNTYPIATLKASKNSALAMDFMNAVLSASGQAVLRSAGFAKP